MPLPRCLGILLSLQLGAWQVSPTVTGDGNLQLYQGLAFHLFLGTPAILPLHFGVLGEGTSLPNLQSSVACSCSAFCMILVQCNALPLVFQGFPLLFSLVSHLWKLWVLHLSVPLLWGPVQVPLKPVQCFTSMEVFSIDSSRGESGTRAEEPVKGELVGASQK